MAFHLWRRTLIQPRFVSLTNPDSSHNLNIIAPSVSPLLASAVCFPPAPPHSPGQLFPAPALGLMLLPLPPLPPPLPPNHLLHSLVSTALTPLPWFVAPDFNATIHNPPISMSGWAGGLLMSKIFPDVHEATARLTLSTPPVHCSSKRVSP